MGYDGSLKFDTRVDESGFNSGITKLGSLAKSGLAVLGSAVAGCVASFGALTKASLDAVASLEQNVGGVETLFKDSADTVIANANRAYKTAGMSANDYMSTVTSFSASLLQSLEGDTKKAAEYADRAIIDMSDNANKMGTSMELIQNAYQGFAKQNYTMLDNLKLGYGGTKEEMKRLIEDASKLTEVQEKLGITVDASSMSFGNIVNAISVMQESMGIAGTTAKEAAKTIEGSMNMAKAAWDNFLAGTISIEDFAEAVGYAAENIFKNLEVIIPRLAKSIPPVIDQVGEEIVNAFERHDLTSVGKDLIQDVITGASEKLPMMAEIGLSILNSVAQSLMANAFLVTEKAAEIVSNLISGIQQNAQTMLTAATWILTSFVEGLASQLPELVPQALQMVVVLADAVIANIPTIVDAGISVLAGLVEGIINGLPTLISEGPRIINDFADAIYSALGKIVLTGLQLIASLVEGIWDNRKLLLENALEIFLAFINIFSLSKLFSLGKSLLTKLIEGIKNLGPNMVSAGKWVVETLISGIKALATHPVTTLKEIAKSAMSAVKGLDWRSIGSGIVSGIANGLKNGVGAIVSAAQSAAQSALNAAKRALGIHSPSRVFRDVIGKNMALGMGVGFEKNVPIKAMTKDVDKMVTQMQQKVSVVTKETPRNVGTVKNIYETYRLKANTQWDDIENKLREFIEDQSNKELKITNIFKVDGRVLAEETVTKTINKISDDQRDRDRSKGNVAYA